MDRQFVEVGDVVMARPEWVFAHGHMSPSQPYLVGDAYTERYVVHNPCGVVVSEYDQYDPTRGSALYVIEEVDTVDWHERAGYLAGRRVVARRLKFEGSYDPEGERVLFYQSGYYSFISFPEVLGQMPLDWLPV